MLFLISNHKSHLNYIGKREKQFDSDGDLLNANGVAGMDVTGKGTSWQKLTNVSEDHRQKMFDNVKREFIQEKGLSNGDTTKRSDIFKDYQLRVSKDKRLSIAFKY